MIKNYILILFVLFLWGCTSVNDTPTINISLVSINGEIQNNYNLNNEEFIKLETGDELGLTLVLNGHGNELQTFNMSLTDDDLNAELLYDTKSVTTEGNLSDPANGRLRFTDGVTRTEVSLISTIDSITYDGQDIIISFYLSSATSSEGAMQMVTLKVDSDQ